MKHLLLLLLAVCCASAETPEDWFDDYSAHAEKIMQRRIAYIEVHLPGDTTYRKLSEQVLRGQMPLLRYLLRYYLTSDPDRLQWDEYGPFLQVLPCNCGRENAIDSEAFRVLFPGYARASSAWEEIDQKLSQKYSELLLAMDSDEIFQSLNEAEMTVLKTRFDKLLASYKRRKETNQ